MPSAPITTTWKKPSAADGSTYGSGTNWTNPSRITADDNSEATCAGTAVATTKALVGTGFDFSEIPDDATLTSFEARMAVRQSAGAGTCQLEKWGMLQGGSWSEEGSEFDVGTSPELTGSETLYQARISGNSNLVSGLGLTVAEIKDSGFGIGLAGLFKTGSATIAVDYLEVRAIYTTPLTPASAWFLLT